MENTLKDEDYRWVANAMGLEPAIVKAVIEVETGKRGAFVAPMKPVILFEGHVFWRRLKLYGLDPVDYMRGNEDILHVEWTRRNYKGGLKEYERLERARKIHHDSALESTSWGLFQIMGFNYEKCGCNNVNEFVEKMCSGIRGQLTLWAEFLHRNGLDECLRNRRWSLFALRYNGRGYKVNHYDKRLKMAYLKYKKEE